MGIVYRIGLALDNLMSARNDIIDSYFIMSDMKDITITEEERIRTGCNDSHARTCNDSHAGEEYNGKTVW